MSKYLAQALTAQKKIQNDELLNEDDRAIIDIALAPIIQEQRTPFQRKRDHYIIGTKRFKLYGGLDYLRTILMHRKSDVWHSDSNMSEISVFEVYTASQLDPPSELNYDREDSTPEEDACELLDRAHIGGPGGSYQEQMEAKSIASLREYVAELSTINTQAAIEKQGKLEDYLREQTTGSEFIEQGDLTGLVDAHVGKYYYRGRLRTIRSPKQVVSDKVRHSTNYAIDVLRENSATADIADHLKTNVRIGQVCEYRGDWRWRF